jgi:hypothetical protein
LNTNISFFLFSFTQQKQLTEEDEALVRELYGADEGGVYIKRIAEPDDDGYGSELDELAMKSLLIEQVDGV